MDENRAALNGMDEMQRRANEHAATWHEKKREREREIRDLALEEAAQQVEALGYSLNIATAIRALKEYKEEIKWLNMP